MSRSPKWIVGGCAKRVLGRSPKRIMSRRPKGIRGRRRGLSRSGKWILGGRCKRIARPARRERVIARGSERVLGRAEWVLSSPERIVSGRGGKRVVSRRAKRVLLTGGCERVRGGGSKRISGRGRSERVVGRAGKGVGGLARGERITGGRGGERVRTRSRERITGGGAKGIVRSRGSEWVLGRRERVAAAERVRRRGRRERIRSRGSERVIGLSGKRVRAGKRVGRWRGKWITDSKTGSGGRRGGKGVVSRLWSKGVNGWRGAAEGIIGYRERVLGGEGIGLDRERVDRGGLSRERIVTGRKRVIAWTERIGLSRKGVVGGGKRIGLGPKRGSHSVSRIRRRKGVGRRGEGRVIRRSAQAFARRGSSHHRANWRRRLT